MVWVKSEYAGEVAVLATWLGAFLPWSVGWLGISGVQVVSLRFPLARIQYIFGATVPGEKPFLWAWEVPAFAGSPELTLAAQLGLIGGEVYLVALLVSVVFYVAEEWLMAQPVDPVRLLAALLSIVGLALTGAGFMLVRYDASTVIPIGGPLMLALGALLATADRT
jgi:uncharacterized protein (TIGR04206 family)